MVTEPATHLIPHWIDGREEPALGGETIDKYDPATGNIQSRIARGRSADAERAINAARKAWAAWAGETPVRRGEILRKLAQLLEARREEAASLVARETGKSFKDAFGGFRFAGDAGFFAFAMRSRYQLRCGR